MKLRLFCILALSVMSHLASAQSSAFTYQGQLIDNGTPANGTYDVRFQLYDDAVNGGPIGDEQTVTDVGITNGLFTVTLDFGTNAFPGDDRWIQVGVRTNGGVISIPLYPRQRIAATPYAIRAANAETAVNVSGPVAASSLTGTISDAQLSPNVALLNSNVTFSGTVTAPNLVGVWKLQGNAGTTSNNFIGTTDNEPLQFRMNNLAVMSFQPSFDVHAPNVISGSPSNSVPPWIRGANIAGGGSDGSGPKPNVSESDFTTIGGGFANRISFSSWYAIIAGGAYNELSLSSPESAISGGLSNVITVTRGGTIGGGTGNMISSAYYGTINGGSSNLIFGGQDSTISGGTSNTIYYGAPESVISGGRGNLIRHATYSVIGGGVVNSIHTNSFGSTIGGGTNNVIGLDAYSSTISGGENNIVGSNSFLGTIGGGNGNAIGEDSWISTISGGALNSIETNSTYGTIGGGAGHFIQYGAHRSTIAGGFGNIVGSNSWGGAIGGGDQNKIGGDARYGAIPGGYQNIVSGSYGFAAGHGARALHKGAFVWADALGYDFSSTATNQFSVRASGGARFWSETNAPTLEAASAALVGTWLSVNNTAAGGKAWSMISSGPGNGEGAGKFLLFDGTSTRMQVDSGGLTVNGTFVSSSDRNKKENFSPVNSREILEKVSALPLTSWNYKEDKESRHLGPMAQDFQAAFGVGPDDKHIATVDADGVALAAIQGLNEKLVDESKAKDAAIRALETKNQSLEKRLSDLEALVNSLSQQR